MPRRAHQGDVVEAADIDDHGLAARRRAVIGVGADRATSGTS
jgi:hypothetical protein